MELLVVMVVIAILLSMLLVAYRAIFITAHDATCRNNLRGLGQAVQLYAASDLWHKLPPGEDGNGGNFYDYVLPYAKVASTAVLLSERLTCPLASNPRYCYKMNEALTDTTFAKPYPGKAEYMIRSNLSLVILFEGVPNNSQWTDRGQKQAAMQCRHLKNTSANVFYWGGQVSLRKPADTASDWTW